MTIREYFVWYIFNVPIWGYLLCAVLTILGMLLILWWKGINNGIRYTAGMLLAEDVVFLIYFTIFFRPATGIHNLVLMPFWSYKAIMNGTTVLIQEHIMNVAVFIPIGFLASIVFKGFRWWKIALMSLGLSIIIELMQFFMTRGFCETDDVIHNSLGCLIGIALLKIIKLHRI